MKLISQCIKCDSVEIDEWAESGHYWVHCYNCEYDHDEEDYGIAQDPLDVFYDGIDWLDEL